MPEAAIDKYGDAKRRKNKVGLPEYRRASSPTLYAIRFEECDET